MDYERDQIHEAIKELLIECKYNIIDFYIQEQTYSINYVIDTNIISVDLTINVYSKNDNNLFDEIIIYNNNVTLFTVKYEDMPEEFCKNKIIHLIKNKIIHLIKNKIIHFKSSIV
jgi:hypothetical protein